MQHQKTDSFETLGSQYMFGKAHRNYRSGTASNLTQSESVGCTFVTSSDSRNGMRCDVMRWYWYRRSYSEPDRRIWKFRQEESQGTLGESETWDESYVGAGGLLFLLLHDGSNTRGVGRF